MINRLAAQAATVLLVLVLGLMARPFPSEAATPEEERFAEWLTGEWIQEGAGTCADPHLKYQVDGDRYHVFQVRTGFDLPLGTNTIVAVEGRNARIFHPDWPWEQIIQYIDEETHVLSKFDGERSTRFIRCR